MVILPEHIDKLLARLASVESQLSDPSVAADQEAMRRLVRKRASLKRVEASALRYRSLLRELAEHEGLAASPDTDPELKQLAAEEIAALKNEIASIETELVSEIAAGDDNIAERNAILEIRAGTGGDEAALFAGDLARMYRLYAADKGWKFTIVDANLGEKGGYKEAVCGVEGRGAYGELEHEAGVHRVQRIPATEAAGRIHTSTATVAVFPEVGEEDDIVVQPQDLRIDIYCSSGPGGQSVNTTYSAVRITHLPTGIVAQSQDERSQRQNKEKALKVLKARLLDLKRREALERLDRARRSMIGSAERSERIRTYNFPQNRVTDHRSGQTLYKLQRVMDGAIGELIAAARQKVTTARFEEGIQKLLNDA